ncbi:hypothetical protein KNE206_47200 [Kitasatospora sp. NE20-6]
MREAGAFDRSAPPSGAAEAAGRPRTVAATAPAAVQARAVRVALSVVVTVDPDTRCPFGWG